MKAFDRELKQALLAPFQAAEVRIRDGKPPMPYVTARVVMARLDDVLPFQWDFTLGERWTDEKGTLNQKGQLNLLGPAGETAYVLHYEDIGSAPPDVGAGPKKQAKQAVSDCFKRCAVHVGISRYLYELQGVRADGIPEASLKKALAAVGFTGGYEKHHWGRIGGVRELDFEDEEGEVAVQPEEPKANGNAPDAYSLRETFTKLWHEAGFETAQEVTNWLTDEGIAIRTAADMPRAIDALRARIAAG